MERREIEEIQRFFANLGHRTPLAYYSLPEDASNDDVEAAMKKRRSWAQGQQANPKYRSEALFLIKFNGPLRRLLLEEREVYVDTFVNGQAREQIDELDRFIRGALVGGALTPQIQAAVMVQGRQLGIADGMVAQRIDALANELGVARETDQDVGASASSIDFYELLQVTPFATDSEIEQAYRARYRWARNLKDLERSSQVLSALDDAWRILRDPQRRSRYDAQRSAVAEVTDEVDRRADALKQLLTGTTDAPVTQPDRSAQAMLAEVRARTTAPPQPGGASPGPTSGGPTGHTGGEGFEVSRLVRTEPTTPADPARSSELRVPTAPPVPTPPPLRLAGAGPDVPVPNIPGRTIGLAQGPQQLRERAPRLVVPGKSIIRLTVPRSRPTIYKLKVQNGGQGKMPGKLQSDTDWLVPERPWLDPLAKEQDIEIEIRPSEMSGRKGTGTITVVTDHGERKVISLEVKVRSYAVPLFGLFLMAAVGFVAKQQYDAREIVVPAEPPTVRLVIDPPADRILVDERLVASGASVKIDPPTSDTPFKVRIEADGFFPHEEMITLGLTSIDRAIRLELEDRMDWQPPAGVAATLLDAAAAETLRNQGRLLGACYVEGTRRKATLTFGVRATSDGQIRSLDIQGDGVDLAGGRECAKRIVRATRLVPFAGEWGRLEVPIELSVGR